MASPVSPIPPPGVGAGGGTLGAQPGAAKSPATPAPASVPAAAATAPVDALESLARPGLLPALPPLPAGLGKLAPGARLDGVVVAPAAPDQPWLLRTVHGEAAIATALVLPPDAALMLEIVESETRIVALAVALDGETPPPLVVTLGPHRPPATPPPATAAKPPQLPAPTPLPREIADLPPGARLTGIVLPLAPPRAALLVSDGTLLRLEPGPLGVSAPESHRLPATAARLEVEIVKVATHLVARPIATDGAPPGKADRLVLSPPQAAVRAHALAANPQDGRLARGLSVGQTVTATVVRAFATSGHAAAPAVTTRLEVRLLGYGPPDAAASPSPPPNAAASPSPPPIPAGELMATTVGHDRDGALLAKTAEGVLRLATDAPLPPGSVLILQLVSAPVAAGAPAAEGDHPRLPSLEQAASPASGVSAATVTHSMPNATPRGIANLIAYLFALRSGDTRQWIGERAAQSLAQAGRGGLIARLGEELRLLGRGAGEAASSEWRALPLPWNDGGQLHFPTLWLHERYRPDGKQGEAGTETGTRLIVELELSRLGPMQIDGYYRDRRFDVIVRSRDSLDEDVRKNLHGIFADVLAVSGLAGTLDFHLGEALAFATGDE